MYKASVVREQLGPRFLRFIISFHSETRRTGSFAAEYLSDESRYPQNARREKRKKRRELACQRVPGRIKFSFDRRKNREREGGEKGRERNGHGARSRTVISVFPFANFLGLFLSSGYVEAYLCVYGAPRCAFRGQRRDSSFFLEPPSPNGIAKNSTLPETVKNNASSSFRRYAKRRGKREEKSRFLERERTRGIGFDLAKVARFFSARCFASERVARKFTRNASSWFVCLEKRRPFLAGSQGRVLDFAR